ncbi:MAG: glycosyltransferase [Gemmatimonadaceae bacterium]
MVSTWIVVPCYNEAARLDRDAFQRFVVRADDVGVLFVDDGSTDATSTVLGELVRADARHFRLLALPANAGKAEAVRQGVLAALQDAPQYLGYWDADLATPLDALNELRRVLDEHSDVDLVMGARVQLLGRSIERRAWRHYVGRIGATLISALLELPVYDTQCGAKLFRRSPWTAELFGEPFTTRWLFDVEILARMLRIRQRPGVSLPPLQRAVFEYPLQSWRDVDGSKVGLWDIARTVPQLLRIRRRYLAHSRPAPTALLTGSQSPVVRPRT